MPIKAAALREIGKPLSVEEFNSPTWLAAGQVFVEVKASGICGKQLGEISGHYGPDKYLPHLMGHEGAGIVKAIGPGVKYVKPGDHVVMHWRKGVGIEAEPAKYASAAGDLVGAGPVHTFCTHAVVSENRLTSVPDNLPFEIAALLGCAVTTAFGLVNNEAHLKIGQSIAIIGCGGVGLAIIQAAKLAGAYPIFAIDTEPKKHDLAWGMGASFTGPDLSQYADVVVDTTGKPACIQHAYQYTKPNGKTILVGQPRHDESITLTNVMSGKQLFASQGGLTNPTEDIPRYVRMYQAGRLELDKLISHRFAFEDINKALDTARSGEAIRCMVTME